MSFSSQGHALANNIVQEYAVLRSKILDQSTLTFLHDTATQCSLSSTNNISSNCFHLFQCIQDSSLILLTGIWPSIDAHNQWVASTANKKLLERARALEIQIEEFFHFGVTEFTTLPTWVVEVPVLTVELQYPLDVEDFSQLRKETRNVLAAGTNGHEYGGWRVEAAGEPLQGLVERMDKSEGQIGDEWVEITGWESLEQHQDFVDDSPDHFERIRSGLTASRARHWQLMKTEKIF